MIESIIYRGKSRIAASTTFAADKSKILEIGLLKIIILLILFIFPPLLDQQLLCIITTVLFSLQFWISKNLGRKFLSAAWFIDTSSENDLWVYEASMRSPSQVYEGIFWYSFILYGFILFPLLILSLSQGKLSLSASITIGIVANYINFYAFSKVINMRNEGVLRLIADEAVGEGVGETIKVPLAYQSKLPELELIKENQRSKYGYMQQN